METSFKPHKKLIPFDDQKASMSSAFLYTSYGVTWLGEKVHSFMTKELIAIPFKPASYGEGQDHLIQGNESWTAQTRVYQTELTCTPSEIQYSVRATYNPSEIKAPPRFTYTFSTDGCAYKIDPLYDPNATQTMQYIGFADYYNTPIKQECKHLNIFLAIWAKSRNAHNKSDELDLNALYCKPSYYYQTHEVTVDGADGSILKAGPVGKRTNFTQEDKIFDVTTFEGNLGAAAASFAVNSKFFSPGGPGSTSRFEDWGLDIPTRQISYVIGLSPGKEFDDFKDPMIFRNGLDRMHKLLFNTALETLLISDSGGEEVVGKRGVRSIGIVVVPLVAHLLAGFLGLVVVCLGGVFLVCYNRQNNLAGDPDTLGTKMALIAHSEVLLRDFNGTDECPDPHLCMEPRKYKLGIWGGEGGYRLDAVESRDNPLVPNPHASCTVPHDGKLVGPVELSIWTRLAAMLVNITLLTLLIVLYKSSLRWNGRTCSNSSKIARHC